jgi:1-phosphofructokinase family hexose kinase
MILTVTLNPAVDVSLTTDHFVYDDRTYITSETFQPGGKGVNAARVLAAYGADVEAVAPYGGEMGDRFVTLVAEAGLPVALVEITGRTRRNLAISDSQGLTLKLDQPGDPLSDADFKKIQQVVCEKLTRAAWLTLNGSLAPGVPADYYARMVRVARERGVSTMVDTSGEPLDKALAAKPSLAKPNRPEAERLLDRSLLTERDFAEAAEEIRALGPERAILSLGAQGAVAAYEDGLLRAVTPIISGGSPIGAGDVLGATCVWQLSQGQPFADAFVWGVAAATVAASKPGLDAGTLDEVLEMRDRIELRRL